MPAADIAESCELFERVDRAPFGRMGYVNHGRAYHVAVDLIRIKSCHVFVHALGRQLAVHGGERDHLVPGELDRACLVRGHMARFGGDHAVAHAGQAVDRQLVRLRAAGEEAYLGLRAAALFLYELRGMQGMPVHAVAGILLVDRILKGFYDVFMGPFHVIACECEHEHTPLFCGLQAPEYCLLRAADDREMIAEQVFACQTAVCTLVYQEADMDACANGASDAAAYAAAM